MVQGCTSWAGKSLLATALCRWYARQGVAVAPFKAQTMSNNARVVGGGEIGVAQWLQAHAAGVAPEVTMNPVLIKPEREGSQVVRRGRVDHALSRRPYRQRPETLWPTVTDCLDDLLDRFELVVIEGAGSPAEINLADTDIANMRVAERAAAPVLLVVDIDRGGAFAHLYGTWALLSRRQRRRIAGFVLNRFRGDPALLPPGPDELERLTGVPTLGVVPMLAHDLPDEDGFDPSVTGPADGRRIAVVRYPSASNLDELRPLAGVADLRWARHPRQLADASLVILPGAKHVAAAARWLRRRRLDEAVRRAAADGTAVLGICGGLQLLGERLEDPHGVDGSAPGLGLLPVVTTFERDKHIEHVAVRFADPLPGPWAALAGRSVDGYEIRHGRTRPLAGAGAAAALPDGRGFAVGCVLGVSVHGVLEDSGVLRALAGAAPDRDLQATFDRLADAVHHHLDTDALAGRIGAAT